MPRPALLALLVSATFATAASPAAAENWPRFRGADGSGVSAEKGIPTAWSPGDFAWNVELPGEGHGGPAIWGNKLFITSASDQGATRHVFCLDPATGKEIWSREIPMNRCHKHQKSSWASSTPCTDGERVYFTFADIEHYSLFCYDMDGELQWRRNFGGFQSQHNMGVSPIIYEDMVIVANDQDGPSSIIAVDKRTGATRWSTVRKIAVVSYSTPIILTPPGKKPQLITASQASGLAALDPHTGDTIWHTDPFPLRTVASPVYADGLIIASCGQGGRFGTNLRAVDPTGEGNVEQTHVKYDRVKELPYVPTPIGLGKHVYLWQDLGFVTCVEAKTGKDVWKQRIGGNYSSSPLCIDGKLYGVAESGDVHVIAAKPEYEHLGTSSLGENSHATPAVANGRLFFRTFHRLMALEAKKP